MPVEVVIPLMVVCVPALWAMGAYHRLAGLRRTLKKAFGQFDTQLQRRHELVPLLVASARTHLEREDATLEALIAARNSASSARQTAVHAPGERRVVTQLTHAEAALGGALHKLFALMEAPPAQPPENFAQLRQELEAADEKVVFARQTYNDAVTAYNVAAGQFPTYLVARWFGFKPAAPFDTP